jgi:hypothetical protein
MTLLKWLKDLILIPVNDAGRSERMVDFPHDVPKPKRRILSGPEWKKIAEPSGLPPEARDDVERAINWYRILRGTNENRTKNRDKVDDVSDKLAAALRALQRMQNDQDVFWAIVIGDAQRPLLTSPQRQAWQHRLNGLADELERGLEWWRKSRDRLAGVKRGRRNLSDDLYYLIRQLSFITVEYTGQMTSLSKKDRENSKLNHLKFLVLTCKAADKNIKESLIRDVASGLVIDEDKQFF